MGKYLLSLWRFCSLALRPLPILGDWSWVVGTALILLGFASLGVSVIAAGTDRTLDVGWGIAILSAVVAALLLIAGYQLQRQQDQATAWRPLEPAYNPPEDTDNVAKFIGLLVYNPNRRSAVSCYGKVRSYRPENEHDYVVCPPVTWLHTGAPITAPPSDLSGSLRFQPTLTVFLTSDMRSGTLTRFACRNLAKRR